MKEKREKTSSKGYLLILIIFCGLLVFFIFKGIKHNQEIKTYSGSTIGLANSFKYYTKTKDLNYYFYINDQKIISKTSGNDLYNKNLKKFYQIKYDISNPENNHIIMSNHLKPDSLTLVKAGFTYKKYYEHDIATNTYRERYRWQ